MQYNDQMDKECIKICDALNFIPDIITTGSCCGHNTTEFSVWFQTKNLKQLFPLMRQLSKNYGNNNWTCEISLCDIPEKPIGLFLHSNSKGIIAYKSADKMAEKIIEYLTGHNNWISKVFGVKLNSL